MTRPYRIHTMPTRRRAVGRVAAGESMDRVAFSMDIAKSLLWKWCREDGVRSKHKPITHPEMLAAHRARMASDEQRAQAAAMLQAGHQCRAVAKAVGVSPTAVYNWRKQWRDA
jgi:transposase-like protein